MHRRRPPSIRDTISHTSISSSAPISVEHSRATEKARQAAAWKASHLLHANELPSYLEGGSIDLISCAKDGQLALVIASSCSRRRRGWSRGRCLSCLGLFTLLEMKKWHRRQITEEKLRLISEALEQAEKTTIRFQERHDRILFQINSHYLCRREMEEALAGAQRAMNESLQFCVHLRQMQMKILASDSCGVVDHHRS
ncbi:hypothetical protein BHE74_00006425 [Ensete ventricosum]|nr:hypothetical protein BHE74_00006425 [Ensete ventricosum]